MNNDDHNRDAHGQNIYLFKNHSYFNLIGIIFLSEQL